MEWRPRPGEKRGEMLYCVDCEQFMAPEAFHKSQQKWTLTARECIVCREAFTWGPQPPAPESPFCQFLDSHRRPSSLRRDRRPIIPRGARKRNHFRAMVICLVDTGGHVINDAGNTISMS